MDGLEISLFGNFNLTLAGRSLNGVVSGKACALLAYLGIEASQPHPRAMLATLLWPDQNEAASRANLRQMLHRLLKALAMPTMHSPYLLVNHQNLQFNDHNRCRLDVAEFSQSLAACHRHHPSGLLVCEDCLKLLQTAAGLYRGDLLAEFSLPRCVQFEWWLTCKREEYHLQVIEVLMRLIRYYELKHDYPQAIEYAHRAIALEPWSESLHRQMMLLLARSKQRIAALRQYEICRRIISEEYGVEPGTETANLYQQIFTDTLFPG